MRSEPYKQVGNALVNPILRRVPRGVGTLHNRDVLKRRTPCWQIFFESSFRIHELCDSPDGRLLEGFVQDICRAGYAAITARRHIRAAKHLIYWIGRKRTPIISLDERFVDNFVHHLDRCHCPRYGRTHKRELQNSARLFFDYLRRATYSSLQFSKNQSRTRSYCSLSVAGFTSYEGPVMSPLTTTTFPCAIS